LTAINGPEDLRQGFMPLCGLVPGWPRSGGSGILDAERRANSRELMMLGSSHPIAGLDVATGTFVLMIFSAGVALAVLAVLMRLMLRRAGQSGTAYVWLACGLALAGGMISYALFDRVTVQEQAADRRALEARTAELTARSLAPGSPLGCLDAVASSLVENACERPLFVSPEAVAAAIEYVDARFSLLAPSAALAARDPSYQPMFERLRRGLEADRYGLVAHVLITRGCNGADCAELRLLRDPARVVANMKARTFEASLGAHALAWQSNGTTPAVASAAPFALQPLSTTGALAPAASGGPGAIAPSGSATAGSAKFDFPSANSIPAVSIMSPEPGTPPTAEPRPSTPAPKRAASPARRQSAREAAAPSPPPPAPPPPAAPAPAPQVAPEAAPEPAPRARSDPHSTH
jgi:hypothetical protein